MAEVRIGVQGMTCGSCTRSIEDRLRDMPGVRAVAVSLADAEARVTVDNPRLVTAQQLCAAIDDMGFETVYPRLTAFELPIGGMTCMSCVRSITDRVQDLPGVKSINVDLAGACGRGTLDPLVTSPAAVRDAIDDMGFEAGEPKVLAVAAVDPPRLTAFELPIGGMTCMSCVRSITDRVQDLPGVKSINVDLAGACGRGTLDPSVTSPAAVRDAIDDMGFEAGEPKEVPLPAIEPADQPLRTSTPEPTAAPAAPATAARRAPPTPKASGQLEKVTLEVTGCEHQRKKEEEKEEEEKRLHLIASSFPVSRSLFLS